LEIVGILTQTSYTLYIHIYCRAWHIGDATRAVVVAITAAAAVVAAAGVVVVVVVGCWLLVVGM
jgi:hypothetical protein